MTAQDNTPENNPVYEGIRKAVSSIAAEAFFGLGSVEKQVVISEPPVEHLTRRDGSVVDMACILGVQKLQKINANGFRRLSTASSNVIKTIGYPYV